MDNQLVVPMKENDNDSPTHCNTGWLMVSLPFKRRIYLYHTKKEVINWYLSHEIRPEKAWMYWFLLINPKHWCAHQLQLLHIGLSPSWTIRNLMTRLSLIMCSKPMLIFETVIRSKHLYSLLWIQISSYAKHQKGMIYTHGQYSKYMRLSINISVNLNRAIRELKQIIMWKGDVSIIIYLCIIIVHAIFEGSKTISFPIGQIGVDQFVWTIAILQFDCPSLIRWQECLVVNWCSQKRPLWCCKTAVLPVQWKINSSPTEMTCMWTGRGKKHGTEIGSEND